MPASSNAARAAGPTPGTVSRSRMAGLNVFKYSTSVSDAMADLDAVKADIIYVSGAFK